MKKIETIILGIIGLCIAAVVGHKFIGVEFNVAYFYHTVTGLILGVLITKNN